QSGWAAPQNHMARHGSGHGGSHGGSNGGRFTRTLHTGAHADSARAVAEGRADIAAIDAVSWRLMTAHRPAVAERLRVVCATDPSPGLPLITALGRDPAPLARAAAAAIAALAPADRAALGLKGVVGIPAEAYLAVPTPPPPSQDVSVN